MSATSTSTETVPGPEHPDDSAPERRPAAGAGRRWLGLPLALAIGAAGFSPLAAAPAGATSPCGATGALSGSTCSYTTVGRDTFTVPAGVTSARIEAYGGAGGGLSYRYGGGGLGGGAMGTVNVVPGEVLRVTVAGQGKIGGQGGFGGGANAGIGVMTNGGGGGASDLRRAPYGAADRLVVAGGGGGAGNGGDGSGGDGGHGGGTNGNQGQNGPNPPSGAGGKGGTQSAGGLGGFVGGAAGDASGNGGAGGAGIVGGGGGGGGWFGGGGGGGGFGYATAPSGGGGGGSGFGTTLFTGVRSGNGLVTIDWGAVAAVPALTINDVAVTESDTGSKLATFTIGRSPAFGTSSVSWTTLDGTAVAPGDYAAVAPTRLTFGPGVSSMPVSVLVKGDRTNEIDETFSVKLLDPAGAIILDDTGIGTIVDNDPILPLFSVNDVSVAEGDSGTKLATFTITRSLPTGASSVRWTTNNATAVAPGDFVAVPPTSVAFADGESTKSVSVTVKGDTDPERDETFLVRLTSATGANIADDTGVGTITNDDGAVPQLSVSDATVPEGDSGNTLGTFTITRSGAIGSSSVSVSTVDGTAKAPVDYVAVSSKAVTFAAGETTRTVSVLVNGDTAVEADETFSVKLANATGATIADGTGVGTIVNDDDAVPTLPSLSVNDVSVTEGNSGTRLATFTIARAPGTGASSVNWSTADASAVAPGDYTAVPATTVAFAAGETSKSISVRVNGDTAVEADETFSVTLANATGATIADGTGVGTIVNDDTVVPALSVDDVSLTEGNSGTTLATFSIARSSGTGASSVKWSTADGTAAAPGDYVAVAATTVAFAAGETTKSISVTVNGDTVIEADETFTVRLSGAIDATIADATGVGTIVNDDSGPASQSFAYTLNSVVSDGQPAPGAGNIELPGGFDRYTFTATAGQRVFADRLAGACTLNWRLEGPAGSGFASRRLCDADPGQLTLSAGAYTITVDTAAGSTATGTYSFRITSVPDPQSFTYSLGTTVSDGQPAAGAGNIEMPGAIDRYSFTATAGQRVFVDRLTGPCTVNWRLEGPGGPAFPSRRLCDPDPGQLVLGAGTYTITVDTPTTSDATGTYSFRITNVPGPQSFTYEVGTTVSDGQPAAGAGNIEMPGAVDRYSFTATAGQRVLIDRLAGPCVLNWRLEGPGGSGFAARRMCDADPGQFTLSAGTYTITVDTPTTSDATGTYSFRITNV